MGRHGGSEPRSVQSRTWTHRLAVGLVGSAIAVATLTAAAQNPAAATIRAADPAARTAPSPALEGDFLNRINALRAARGVPALTVSAELNAGARSWAGALASAQELSHQTGWWNSLTVPWVHVGENVGTGGDTEGIWNAFLASPTHLNNLVDPTWTHLGVAVMVDDGGRIWTVHRFLQMGGAPPPPAVPPAAPPAVPPTVPPTAPPVAPPVAPPTTTAPPPPPPSPPPPPPDTIERVRVLVDGLDGAVTPDDAVPAGPARVAVIVGTLQQLHG